jgi:hypothetical protein
MPGTDSSGMQRQRAIVLLGIVFLVMCVIYFTNKTFFYIEKHKQVSYTAALNLFNRSCGVEK